MTPSEVLNGAKINRTNEAARAGVLMTEANVHHYIQELEKLNPNKNARKRMAEIASKNVTGMIAPCGVALWKKYLKTFAIAA